MLNHFILALATIVASIGILSPLSDAYSQDDSGASSKKDETGEVTAKDESSDAKSVKADSSDDSDQQVDFAKTITPIFNSKCRDCHGEENQEGDLNFDERETLAEFITPGKRNESSLFTVLISDDEDEQMPPPYDVEAGDAEAITPEEIELVGLWIDQGASFDSENSAESKGTSESTGENEEEKEQQHIAMRIWRFAGSFHPALVHFPIALFSVGAFFVIFCRRNMALANEASFYCLALGSLGAIVAAAVGWSLAFKSMPFDNNQNIWDMEGSMFWHRWLGVAVAVLSLVIWIIAWRQRSEDYADGGGSWKLGLVLLAGIVGLVGYQGGELVYGDDHYVKELKRYLPEAHEAIFPKEDAEAGGDKEESPDESTSKDSDETSSDNSNSGDETKDGDEESSDKKSDAEAEQKTDDSSKDDDIDT